MTRTHFIPGTIAKDCSRRAALAWPRIPWCAWRQERTVPLVAAAGRAEPSPTERGRYPLEWRTVQRTVETWAFAAETRPRQFGYGPCAAAVQTRTQFDCRAESSAAEPDASTNRTGERQIRLSGPDCESELSGCRIALR